MACIESWGRSELAPVLAGRVRNGQGMFTRRGRQDDAGGMAPRVSEPSSAIGRG
jgi:hypothetical protein